MDSFKKTLLIMGVCVASILIIYVTFNAVSRVHRMNDPVRAKKVVILTFFTNAFIFAGGGYLAYRMKVPTKKK
jgi:hypothetical protein